LSNRRRASREAHWLADCNKRLESLKRVALLADLEASNPGIVLQLAKEAKLVREVTGQVVMRQGDSPGMFCVLTSGHVGVFKVPDEDLSANRDRDPIKDVAEIPKLPTISEYLERWPDAVEQHRQGEFLRRPSGDLVRFKTSDGLSSYNQETVLGDQLLVIGPVNIFGELALLHGDRRKATVKCLTPCEFLKFKIHDFEASGMQAAMQKYLTFDRFVQNCGSLHGMGRHPASFFSFVKLQRGDRIITEGTMPEACIFLVQNGSLEFSRALEHDDPVRDLAGATLRMSLQRPERPSEIIEEVREGALFCSLAALPIQAHEPYSVRVVSAEAEVLLVRSSKIRSMPIEILQPLREQLLKSTTARVRDALGTDRKDTLSGTRGSGSLGRTTQSLALSGTRKRVAA